MGEKTEAQLDVEVRFDSWDGDGTVTLTHKSGQIALDVKQAEEQLQAALAEIRQRKENLYWNS